MKDNRAEHNPGGARSSNGFTLLEVMITLAIIGMMLLIIFGAFRLGLSAWEKGETIKEDYQKLRIVSQLLSRQVKSAVPYKIKSQKAEGDYLAFDGQRHSLKFVSTLSLKVQQPVGFTYTVYEFEEGGREGGRLVLYEQRVLTKDFMEDRPKEEMGVDLFTGVSDVRFEYYRDEDKEKTRSAEWVEQWNTKEEKALPTAVKMTLVSKKEEGKKEQPPILIVASLPSNRYEEVKIAPGRRMIPTQSAPLRRP